MPDRPPPDLARRGPSGLEALLGLALVAALAAPARAQIVVDETAELQDFTVGDGLCRVCLGTDDDGDCVQYGGCSFYAALQTANETPGPDVITFAVSTVAAVELPFPELTSAVEIDGRVGTGRVRIVGPGDDRLPGLLFSGASTGGSWVHDVEIVGLRFGLEFRNSPDAAVQGCVIRGHAAWGIAVVGASAGARIGGDVDDPELRNVIVGNQRGIVLQDSGDHRVVGNLIGTDETGQDRGNRTGIVVGPGAGQGTRIGGERDAERNVIANSLSTGISVSGVSFGGTGEPVRDLVVQGNYVGTDPTGLEAAPNRTGISLSRTDGVVIGGLEAAQANLIAGNEDGIWLNARAERTRVVGNRIGLGADREPLPNGNGVVLRSSAADNDVEDNLIAGNTENGVYLEAIDGVAPGGNRIVRNWIGFDPETSDPVGNGESGVRIDEGESNEVRSNEIAGNGQSGVTLVGTRGTRVEDNSIGRRSRAFDPGLSNGESGVLIVVGEDDRVIGNRIQSNERYGVDIRTSTGVVVSANTFGGLVVTVSGVVFGLHNRLGGVRVAAGSAGTIIGASPGSNGGGNEFHSRGDAVLVVESQGTTISENVIRRGHIDLDGDGVDGVDPLDADAGANGKQNAPSVTEIVAVGGGLRVRGELVSAPSSAYRIEVFWDKDGLGRYGFPVALGYAGAVDVMTDASGVASWTLEPMGPLVSAWASATATDAQGNTSELSVSERQPDHAAFGLFRFPEEEPVLDEEGDLLIPLEARFRGDAIESVELRFEAEGVVVEEVAEPPTEDAPLPRPLDCEGEQTISCRIGAIEGEASRLVVARFGPAAAGRGAAAGGPYTVRVVGRGVVAGDTVETNEVVFAGEAAVGAERGLEAGLALEAPFPNPAAGRVTIRYRQPGPAPARVTVTDLLGRRVAAFPPTTRPGAHAVVWDAAGTSAGVYVVHLKGAGGRLEARRLAVVR